MPFKKAAKMQPMTMDSAAEDAAETKPPRGKKPTRKPYPYANPDVADA